MKSCTVNGWASDHCIKSIKQQCSHLSSLKFQWNDFAVSFHCARINIAHTACIICCFSLLLEWHQTFSFILLTFLCSYWQKLEDQPSFPVSQFTQREKTSCICCHSVWNYFHMVVCCLHVYFSFAEHACYLVDFEQMKPESYHSSLLQHKYRL